MAQLPLGWNPGESTPRTRPSPPPDEPLTVSELSTSIVEALERLPSTLRVRGEISNLSTRRHWYFSLKDEHALIGCVMWSSRTRGVESVPAEGDEVEVSGHIAHYAPQGRTQFIVERLRPAGAGALRARFEALCAELREAQADALRLPATGMAVTMDVGNPKDIHPVAKEPVGHRLAPLARADVYGHDVIARSPVVQSTEVDGATMVLRFAGACLPLETLDGSAPTHFELAGEDRVYHPATAVVDGDSIRLTSDAVAAPVAARFAWDDDAEPNLAGACGLPVGPFRTDRWPRVTSGRW